jgi:transposase
MVVFPGLSESLGTVGKRISRFDTTETGLSAEAASFVRRAVCPTCSRPSSRRHGQYRRRLRPHPCMGRSVILHVQVRRFKCLNPQCPRMTFVEPVESLAPTKQRGTVGFRGASCAIAQALGGSAGARLSAKLGMPNSRDTLLRALRRLGSEVTMAPPAVVGIDDWAITRGHRYGTIVVDLERRCPIEVLDERESTSVAESLQRYPSIQVVARDRAGAYSDAAETVIPRAQQVADRWHLLVNLRETVERLLRGAARRRKPAVADAARSRGSSVSADGLAEVEHGATCSAIGTLRRGRAAPSTGSNVQGNPESHEFGPADGKEFRAGRRIPRKAAGASGTVLKQSITVKRQDLLRRILERLAARKGHIAVLFF